MLRASSNIPSDVKDPLDFTPYCSGFACGLHHYDACITGNAATTESGVPAFAWSVLGNKR